LFTKKQKLKISSCLKQKEEKAPNWLLSFHPVLSALFRLLIKFNLIEITLEAN
jgi:hypothetical protein